MSHDGRAPGTNIVYVLVSVHVTDLGAVDALENDWLAADGLESTNRAVDATGDEILSFLKYLRKIFSSSHNF